MEQGKFILHHTKQRKGSAVYVYYMIAWYFRKCKKPFRQIINQLDERMMVSKITQLTEKQKRLLDILDCTYLVSPKYLMEKGIISIDKKCA